MLPIADPPPPDPPVLPPPELVGPVPPPPATPLLPLTRCACAALTPKQNTNAAAAIAFFICAPFRGSAAGDVRQARNTCSYTKTTPKAENGPPVPWVLPKSRLVFAGTRRSFSYASAVCYLDLRCRTRLEGSLRSARTAPDEDRNPRWFLETSLAYGCGVCSCGSALLPCED
jgi:hypothetical protein